MPAVVQGSSPGVEAGPVRAEVAPTLAGPVPRTLGVLDQLGLWGNLGVSLLGFTGALVVLRPNGPGSPPLSLLAAVLATVVGTAAGAAAVAVAGVVGAQTGAPSMVLLRGLFGAGPSYVPTVANVVQMVGWGTFELVTIAAAAGKVLPAVPRAGFVLVAGGLSTLLAMRPLGAVRILRRYFSLAVVLALGYLFVWLLRSPLPPVEHGGWSGFAVAVDATLAVAVSWVPMAADYTRHSRSPRAAATGALVGYGLAQVACYGLGLLALVSVGLGAGAGTGPVFAVFLAVPAGGLVFAVLVVRELDQSFANVYSTTVSLQNLRPGWDRRLISLAVGALITGLGLAVNIGDYASFLSMIGSVFVPMFAVLVVDYFGFAGRQRWDLARSARPRPVMILPWLAGFAVYQLIYPGSVSWWVRLWQSAAQAVGFSAQPWMSASLCSFVVAAAATGAVHLIARARGRRA